MDIDVGGRCALLVGWCSPGWFSPQPHCKCKKIKKFQRTVPIALQHLLIARTETQFSNYMWHTDL